MAKKESSAAYLIKLVIGLFFIFAFGRIVPPWSVLTPSGVVAIGTFIGVVFMISTGFGLVVPAILGMFSLQLTGFFTSSSIIAATMGSSTIYQLIIVYALCYGIIACGAGDFIAKWLITRKFAQGRPMAFTAMFLFGSVVMGALVGIGGVLFYLSILEAIRVQLGYEEGSKWNKLMLLGTYASAVVGFAVIPYKSIPLLIFTALEKAMTAAGYPVNYISFMISVIIVAIVFVILYCFLLKFVFKADMSRLKSLDITKVEGMGGALKMTKQQAIVCIGFLVGILYSIIVMFLDTKVGFGKFFNGISQVIWFALVLAVLSLIKVDGKPAINPVKALKEGVDWSVIFAMCIFSALPAMLTNNDLGVKTWINLILEPVFGNMSFPVFMLVLIALTLIITNFFSNTAIGLIMISICTPFILTFVETIGISPSIVCAAIVTACMFAFLTMAASGSAPLLLGKKAMVDDPKFIWTYGLLLCIIAIVLFWILFTVMAYIF